jgi:hypothetical protein
MTTHKVKIAEFRSAISSLSYCRRESCNGGTHEEFLRCQVPTMLNRHIAIVEAMLPNISLRFVEDRVDAKEGIALANAMIDRWTKLNAERAAVKQVSSQPRLRLAQVNIRPIVMKSHIQGCLVDVTVTSCTKHRAATFHNEEEGDFEYTVTWTYSGKPVPEALYKPHELRFYQEFLEVIEEGNLP